MSKIDCINHHEACACRELWLKEMERTLKIIYAWAESDAKLCEDCHGNFKDIATKAKRALNYAAK